MRSVTGSTPGVPWAAMPDVVPPERAAPTTVHLVVIVGPTASGKTRLGVEVAHRLGSEIVSADSRQVYRGLDLGTGKDLDEYAAVSPPVPVHLVDVAPPERVYTLFDYQRDCYRLLESTARDRRLGSARRPVVMVGGTGLYVEAVLRQYRIPDVPEDPGLRARLLERPRPELVAELEAADPDLAARTDLASAKRVVRALEVVAHRGRFGAATSAPLGCALRFRVFAVQIPRPELHRRIDRRLDERLEAGMVAEVRGLLERGVTLERLHLLGMEYRYLGDHLAGACSLEEAVERLRQEIRHLAKRQETYFRGLPRRGIPVTPIAPGDSWTILAEVAGVRWDRDGHRTTVT